MIPAKYNSIFAAWQKRFAAWKRGERPPPYPARIITQIGLGQIFHNPHRYHEGMGRWTEDVIIRGIINNGKSRRLRYIEKEGFKNCLFPGNSAFPEFL